MVDRFIPVVWDAVIYPGPIFEAATIESNSPIILYCLHGLSLLQNHALYTDRKSDRWTLLVQLDSELIEVRSH